MPTSSAPRQFAEEPAAWGELAPDSGYTRIVTDRYCLLWGASRLYTQVSRLRLAEDEVAETLREVRALAAEHGRRNATWNVASSATPPDLVDRLAAHGLVPDDHSNLASLDGRAVGSAAKAHLEPGTPGVLLVGGAVLPGARGRGAYRTLVCARWDDAVAEGFGGVCVQAGAVSRPILERLGFERVAEHELLGDPATC